MMSFLRSSINSLKQSSNVFKVELQSIREDFIHFRNDNDRRMENLENSVSYVSDKFENWRDEKAVLLSQIAEMIKGSIEPTHGSVCSDVRKLQSMDVLELQSTKADWNTKCHFQILAYIYSNILDISTSYFIQILSSRERLDLNSQKRTFHLDFRKE